MHYVQTTTRVYHDCPLPTPSPPSSENRPADHRPKPLVPAETIEGPDEQQRPATPPQREFRTYGRGGAGSRRPRVKPDKRELNPKDKPKFPSFKFPAKWRPQVPTSRQTPPSSPGFYDMPWCGPSLSSQSAPSLPSSTSSPAASNAPRPPLDDSAPMFTQRDLFLANLWKRNSKKTRTFNTDSLSVTRSTSSTFSGHSSSASGSSFASLSRPEEGDDSASEMYTEFEPFENPPSAPYDSPEWEIGGQNAGAASGCASSSTTEITVVGMGNECDVLDAMRKLRTK